MHENLFVKAPTQSGTPLQTWDPKVDRPRIVKDFKAHVQTELEGNPGRAFGWVKTQTTQADAEAAAVSADGDLHAKYPQIPRQLTSAEIRAKVTVFAPDFEPKNAPSGDFLANWIENQLPMRTDFEDFAVPGAEQKKVVDTLVKDSSTFPITGVLNKVEQIARKATPKDPAKVFRTVDHVRTQIENQPWSWVFNRMSSRTAAFEGSGRVFVSEGLAPEKRRMNLLHELIHDYGHPDYKRWVEPTTSKRVFNEGFTEILTRAALTPDELTLRLSSGRSYTSAVDMINQKIMPFISLDDLAHAYFRGEVWRIEAKSPVAQEMFEKQIGLAAGAAREDEKKASVEGPGIAQVVEPDSYFRLMNFGTDRSTPKAAHEEFLRTVILPMAQKDPTLRLRFVGHADETGAAFHNALLSRARATAVYRLALKLGIPKKQLIDPRGLGAKEPTAPNAGVHGPAFNRRVEIFVDR